MTAGLERLARPLPVSFYERAVVTVARELIGCLLVRHTTDGPLAGRIVEAEAYRQDEPASHSYGGPRPRNAPMYGPAGNAYVYLIYGMYDCFNVVCGPAGQGDAVLIRAIEPAAGVERMWRNRYGEGPPMGSAGVPGPGRLPAPLPARCRNLTSGPGRLCRALDITRDAVNGTSLLTGPVTVHPGPVAGEVEITRRIGISKAVELEWRFAERGNPFVSRPPGR